MYLVHQNLSVCMVCQVATEKNQSSSCRGHFSRRREGREGGDDSPARQALGVTPDGAVLEFKTKGRADDGLVDYVLTDLRATGKRRPWPEAAAGDWWRARTFVHAQGTDPGAMLHSVEKTERPGFTRATNDALTLTSRGVASECRRATGSPPTCCTARSALIAAQPDVCPAVIPADQVDEWRRQKRLY